MLLWVKHWVLAWAGSLYRFKYCCFGYVRSIPIFLGELTVPPQLSVNVLVWVAGKTCDPSLSNQSIHLPGQYDWIRGGFVTQIRPIRDNETHPGFLLALLRERPDLSLGEAEVMGCKIEIAVIVLFI